MEKHITYSGLDEAAAYLNAIFETATDAIITITEKGVVESMNPAAEVLFGYTAAELVGEKINTIMSSPHREKHDQYLSHFIETREAKIIGIGREVIGRHKNGMLIPVRLAVSETIVNGRRFFTGILHDLSSIKAAEEEIRQLNQELELKVEERTLELELAVNQLLAANQKLSLEVKERKQAEAALLKSETELRESLEKEKELSQLKSRFVTMASHEFRTPLSTILSSADLIDAYTKNTPDDKRLKHVKRIQSAVGSLTNILDDFLSLAKLEEDRVQLQPSHFSLREFCDEIEEEFKSLLKPGQEMRHPDGVEDKLIYLDKTILKNILYNLVGNAIKYSAADKPIDCFVKHEDGWLTLKVKDYGIGIPAEDQQHLFTRFFRANNAMNIQGTGLGLNIVRRYLRLMKGEITFKSQEGVGSIFTVRIPLEDVPSVDEDKV
ncbi:MAG: PAS domain-containing sensor histidine kinase [Saprospiraceae bacterium]